MTSFRLRVLAVLGLALCTTVVQARDNFALDVVGTNSTLNLGGRSLPDLIDDLVNAEGAFQTFNDEAFNASVTYGGVPNAILLSANDTGTSATLTIPSTGFTRTFTGPNRDAVEDQIRDFLLEEGATAYAAFLQAINEQSLLGIVDGNPRATTAIMSDHAFYTFGLARSPLVRLENPTRGNVASNFRFDFTGGVGDNDVADETFFTGEIGTGFVGENFGVTLTTIANYRDIEGSSFFNLGFEVGVPFFLIKPQDADQSFSWQLTPAASVSGGASYDAAAGGTMWGVGITSALSYRIDRWVFTLANQITHYEGFSIEIGEYEFDTLVSQQVLKNGVGVAYLTSFGAIDANIAYTNFLQDAALDGYWSPSVGISFGFGEASGFRIAYRGDFDSDTDYEAHGLQAQLYFGL